MHHILSLACRVTGKVIIWYRARAQKDHTNIQTSNAYINLKMYKKFSRYSAN